MADSSKWHRYANNSTKATNSSHSAHITKNNYNKFEGGGKTIAQTPAPKSDRIYGSKKNIEGSAATEGSNIELSEKTVETLKDKLKEFKEKHPNVENITLEDLKKVYRRGSGAYSKSHRPTITGGAPNTRAAWSFARVNKFLEKAAGHKVKKAYVQDDDLIKYEDGGLTHSLEMAMTNLKKNGIVLKNSGITVIAYNTGNQERKPSLYSKKVIYDAIPSKKVASKIIQEVDKGNYENFNQSKIDDYKKSNLIIVNQNEVVYDSSNSDIRYEDGGLIAPNGKVSNLTPEQYKLVRTPAFKKWFGDWENDPENASKVLDENGEPLVVYHGSRYGGINIFDIKKSKRVSSGLKEYGNFFTSNILVAELYRKIKYTKEVDEERIKEISKLEKLLDTVKSNREYRQIEMEIDKWYSKVYEVFLNLRKVKEFDAKLGTNKEGYYNLEVDAGYKIASGNDAIEFLKEGKFGVEKVDGIIAYNVVEIMQKTPDWQDYVGNSYLVFDSQNIKLADGTNTTFDASNPDIRYDDGGSIKNDAFKKWFGNSKVVDKKGNPLIVYHGSPDLRGLKSDYIFKLRFNDGAFFFTSSYSMAKSYADERRAFDYQNAEGGVMFFYLSLQNPLIIDAKNQIWRKFETEINGVKIIGTRDLIKYAKNNDFDGLIIKNVRDYYNNNEKIKKGEDEYIVFEPTQIKLADGSNTIFDAANPDIRYEDGGLNKDIVCKNCGWSWNTADSDESDKYVCHKCGFDNSPYYEHDGIKKENNMEERVISLPDTYSNEERLKEILNQQGYDIVKSNNDANLNNNDMKEYLAEGGHVKGDGVKSNDAKHGGYFEGKSHAEGGIKAVNVDTKQPIEVEGNEVVINKRSVADNTLHEFNGRKMTNKQILSEINQSGGGVAFAKGGQTDNDRHDFNENKYVANQDRYKYLSSDVYANGGTIHDHELNDLEMSILAKLGHSTLRKTEISAEKLHEIKGIEKKGIVYSTPSKKHKDCFDVRLTDFGMELLDGIELKYDSKFAEGGEMDCGCSQNKYRDGGETDVFPPIIFNVSSKEDGKKLHQEAINYTGGNNFSIKKSGDKDYYYANTEAAFELLNELYKEKNGLKETESNIEKKYFQGIDYKYANQFEVNKAIEEFVATKEVDEFTPSEKAFIGYYAGYGGLEKLGGEGKGLLYEYFTPSEIAKKMWGLAYKYGFKGGKVLEPSCGIGEFLKYAPDQDMLTGYEINKISAKICKILYPKARIESKYFETLFIKNNNSIRGDIQNVEKYSLIIGNPPYGSMGGIYAGMGEKSYSKANNYIEYFIFRGLDLLESGGLLIYIIGTEVAVGGTPFLKQEMNRVKSMIAEKADLVDAYRLPNGLFETTDVLTDIIVLKKK